MELPLKEKFPSQKKFYREHKAEQNQIRNINYHISKGLDRNEIKAYLKQNGYDRTLLYCKMKCAGLKMEQLSKVL